MNQSLYQIPNTIYVNLCQNTDQKCKINHDFFFGWMPLLKDFGTFFYLFNILSYALNVWLCHHSPHSIQSKYGVGCGDVLVI